jgi:rhamnose transport system permease protein
VSISGVRGGLTGVLAAVALLATLRNALQLAYVPANTLTIITGSLLIISVVGPNIVARLRERQQRRHLTSITTTTPIQGIREEAR